MKIFPCWQQPQVPCSITPSCNILHISRSEASQHFISLKQRKHFYFWVKEAILPRLLIWRTKWSKSEVCWACQMDKKNIFHVYWNRQISVEWVTSDWGSCPAVPYHCPRQTKKQTNCFNRNENKRFIILCIRNPEQPPPTRNSKQVWQHSKRLSVPHFQFEHFVSLLFITTTQLRPPHASLQRERKF